MSEKLHINILQGIENCKIYKQNKSNEFEKIKDAIERISFDNQQDKDEYLNELIKNCKDFLILSDNELVYIMENSEIPADYVRCIRIDKDENLWLACDSLLVKYNWIVWDIKNPNQNFGRIIDIELDGETVWFATQKGLVKYKEERFELIDLSQK